MEFRMRNISQIIDRAPSVSSEAPFPKIAGVKFTPHIPSQDEEDTTDITLNGQKTDLDNCFCIIEYKDSGGQFSRRRITMRCLLVNEKATYIQAICHERNAYRNFRFDRITAAITEDGEIIDFGEHLKTTLGILYDDSAASESRKLFTDAARIRDRLRPALSILVSLARADDRFHPSELDEIMLYAEKEIIALNREGRLEDIPSLEALDLLAPMILNMRPTRESLAGYILRICEWDGQRIERLQRAIGRVTIADGRFTFQEHDLISDINALAAVSRSEAAQMLGVEVDELFETTSLH